MRSEVFTVTKIIILVTWVVITNILENYHEDGNNSIHQTKQCQNPECNKISDQKRQ
jgi:hypothetical protein